MLSRFISKLTTDSVRFFLAGHSANWHFKKCNNLVIPKVNKTGLYVHVPFCEQLCPYCPYNRIRYDKELADEFINAAAKEMKYYSQQLNGVEISSVYFGGGTPTVLGNNLEKLVCAVRDNFSLSGPLCIETHPADLTEEKVRFLKSIGVDLLSLGVQSFNKKFLNFIGRKYTPEKIEETFQWIKNENIPALNIDIMFALPSQTIDDLKADLEKAVSSPAEQITAYPLFTFPYSSVGKYLSLKKVVMPNLSMRRQMYYFIYDYLTEKGYKRVSVWSFKKGDSPRYSSVTREKYLGIGPGSGSFYGPLFTLNTFSVKEYIKSVKEKSHAVALEITFSKMQTIIYDFYWRLYDTVIPKKQGACTPLSARTLSRPSQGALYNTVTPKEQKSDYISYDISKVKRLRLFIALAKITGMVKEEKDCFVLTRCGSFWLHLMQNYFFLRYVNNIWSAAMKDDWPDEIKF